MLCIDNILQVNDTNNNNLTHDGSIILSQVQWVTSLLVTIVIIHSIHPSLLYLEMCSVSTNGERASPAQ